MMCQKFIKRDACMFLYSCGASYDRFKAEEMSFVLREENYYGKYSIFVRPQLFAM